MSKTTPFVLIVEDEPLLLLAITKKLKVLQMATIPCSSVQEALDYLNGAHEMPDVIWLDYYLKDKNGIDFMEELKKNEKWKDIPVLVVSNSASPEKVQNMLALGAKKYILKAEHRLDEIGEMIRDLMKVDN